MCTISSLGQYRKFAFIEGGGSGVLVNAVIDMRFSKIKTQGLGFKVGIGNTFYIDDASATTYSIRNKLFSWKKP